MSNKTKFEPARRREPEWNFKFVVIGLLHRVAPQRSRTAAAHFDRFVARRSRPRRHPRCRVSRSKQPSAAHWPRGRQQVDRQQIRRERQHESFADCSSASSAVRSGTSWFLINKQRMPNNWRNSKLAFYRENSAGAARECADWSRAPWTMVIATIITNSHCHLLRLWLALTITVLSAHNPSLLFSISWPLNRKIFASSIGSLMTSGSAYPSMRSVAGPSSAASAANGIMADLMAASGQMVHSNSSGNNNNNNNNMQGGSGNHVAGSSAACLSGSGLTSSSLFSALQQEVAEETRLAALNAMTQRLMTTLEGTCHRFLRIMSAVA